MSAEKGCSILWQCSRVRLLFSFTGCCRISVEPYRGLKLRRKKPRFYYPFFFPLFTSTHALINPTEPSPHCNTRRSGLRLPSPEALSLQVEVVTLPALVIQNTAKVCECTCIHLFMAEIKKKKKNPVFRLTPHCHRLLRTRAQTHAYILHTMFRGLNDRGWRFPRWQKKRDKLSAWPAAPVWRREERKDGRVESEEMPNERSPTKFVLYLWGLGSIFSPYHSCIPGIFVFLLHCCWLLLWSKARWSQAV